MNDIEERMVALERRVEKLEQTISANKAIFPSFEKSLAERFSLSPDDVALVFHVSGNDYHLIADIPGDTEEARLINTALPLMTFHYHLTNSRRMRSSELRKKLASCGVPMCNMATLLKKNRMYFIAVGKPKSPKFEYEITTPGMNKGVEIIKQMASQRKGH